MVRDWEGDWAGDGLGVWEGELIGVEKACEHPRSLRQPPQEPGPRPCHKAHSHDPRSIVSNCWVITGRAGRGAGRRASLGVLSWLGRGSLLRSPLAAALPGRGAEVGGGHCVARGGVDVQGPDSGTRNCQQRQERAGLRLGRGSGAAQAAAQEGGRQDSALCSRSPVSGARSQEGAARRSGVETGSPAPQARPWSPRAAGWWRAALGTAA